jgi:methylated-DNA-[protein]-cysteine S-methyltransferase
MSQRTVTHYHSPVAWLEIVHDDGRLVGIRFIDEPEKPCSENGGETVRQLAEYFTGKRREFDLPLHYERGTGFQRAVWDELCAIPYGETGTYGEIATGLGRPGAARAVGGACGANPLPIVVPCHRVLRGGGSLGGFAYDLEIKRNLLKIEGIITKPGKTR